MMQTDTEFSGVLNLCSADWTTMSSYLTSVITNMDSMCREEGSLHVSLYNCMWWINILLQIFLHVFKFSGLVPAEKKKILSPPDFSQNGSLLCSCEIGIQFGAHGPVSTSRDALVLPVCSVNQWFPGEACLKLFKLSARSLEGNLKSADKLLCPPQHLPHLALPHICHSCHLLTSCGQISLSTLSGISMYRSIWLEYYGLSLRYLENTGASAVCLLPKHPAAACLIWQSYRGTSHTHISPAALYTDKGLLQVQSTSKTTGDTLPLG